MLVGAKVCDLTEDLLWFACGLYVEILMSSLTGCPFPPLVHYPLTNLSFLSQSGGDAPHVASGHLRCAPYRLLRLSRTLPRLRQV